MKRDRQYKAVTRLSQKADFMFIVCEEGIEEQYDYCVENIIPKYIKQGISFEEIAIIVQYNKHAKELGIICGR